MIWVFVLLGDPWPLTETQFSDTGPDSASPNYLVVFRFLDAMQTVKASGTRSGKETSKHQWTSTMFDHRESVLFFKGLVLLLANSSFDVLHNYFGLISPQDILPGGFWIGRCKLQPGLFMFVSARGSPWVSYHGVRFHSNGDGECELTLELEVDWGSLAIIIQTILHRNLLIFFPFHPRLERLTTVP